MATAKRTKKQQPPALEPNAVALGGLNIKQELFCRYYTQNTGIFGNATLAYAEAYGYRLDELSNDDGSFDERTQKRTPSSREKAHNVCSVEGHRLLTKPKILERITALLNELLTDDVVDAELTKVILQNDELAPKVNAIREYNKLRQRVTDRLDLTSKGKSIADLILLVHGNTGRSGNATAEDLG